MTGSIADVDVFAIGTGDSAPGTLEVGTLIGVIKLASHPSTSALTVVGGSVSTGDIIVNGSIDGPLAVETPFMGRLCATNAKLDPDNVDVVFGVGALVCDIVNGECANCDLPKCVTETRALMAAPAAEPSPAVTKERFISFGVPQALAGQQFAIKVTLTSLHRPDPPAFIPDPDFTLSEGQVRYVNSVGRMCTGGDQPDPATKGCATQADCDDEPLGGTCTPPTPRTVFCVDSPAQETDYRCAVLGCQPELLDWASLVGSEVLHVTGNAIVPSSVYDVRFLQDSEATVACRSPGLSVETGRWGDANADGLNTISDVVAVVDALKQLPGSLPERQVYVRSKDPEPKAESVKVGDIVSHVEALKLAGYPFPIDDCPPPQ